MKKFKVALSFICTLAICLSLFAVASILGVFASGTVIPNSAEGIPDAKFYEYLATNFGSDGKLTVAEAEAITDISYTAWAYPLTSLEGIGFLKNLETFVFRGTAVSEIPSDISNCSNLTKLHIYDNGALTSLENLENNTAITDFRFAATGLTSMKGFPHVAAKSVTALDLGNVNIDWTTGPNKAWLDYFAQHCMQDGKTVGKWQDTPPVDGSYVADTRGTAPKTGADAATVGRIYEKIAFRVTGSEGGTFTYEQARAVGYLSLNWDTNNEIAGLNALCPNLVYLDLSNNALKTTADLAELKKYENGNGLKVKLGAGNNTVNTAAVWNTEDGQKFLYDTASFLTILDLPAGVTVPTEDPTPPTTTTTEETTVATTEDTTAATTETTTTTAAPTTTTTTAATTTTTAATTTTTAPVSGEIGNNAAGIPDKAFYDILVAKFGTDGKLSAEALKAVTTLSISDSDTGWDSISSIAGIGLMPNLVEVSIKGTADKKMPVTALPEDMAKLTKLQKLNMNDTMLAKIENIEGITTLKEIRMQACPELRYITGLPANSDMEALFWNSGVNKENPVNMAMADYLRNKGNVKTLQFGEDEGTGNNKPFVKDETTVPNSATGIVDEAFYDFLSRKLRDDMSAYSLASIGYFDTGWSGSIESLKGMGRAMPNLKFIAVGGEVFESFADIEVLKEYDGLTVYFSNMPKLDWSTPAGQQLLWDLKDRVTLLNMPAVTYPTSDPGYDSGYVAEMPAPTEPTTSGTDSSNTTANTTTTTTTTQTGSSDEVKNDSTGVPDKAFYDILVAKFGTDGKLTKGDLLAVTKLAINDSDTGWDSIYSLDGIGLMPNLTDVSIKGTVAKRIPVRAYPADMAKLTKLKYLNMNDTMIEKIEHIDKITTLREVRMQSCPELQYILGLPGNTGLEAFFWNSGPNRDDPVNVAVLDYLQNKCGVGTIQFGEDYAGFNKDYFKDTTEVPNSSEGIVDETLYEALATRFLLKGSDVTVYNLATIGYFDTGWTGEIKDLTGIAKFMPNLQFLAIGGEGFTSFSQLEDLKKFNGLSIYAEGISGLDWNSEEGQAFLLATMNNNITWDFGKQDVNMPDGSTNANTTTDENGTTATAGESDNAPTGYAFNTFVVWFVIAAAGVAMLSLKKKRATSSK